MHEVHWLLIWDILEISACTVTLLTCRLVDQGHSVVGIEIYAGAVEGIFTDAGLSPKVTSVNNNLTLYEVECV